MVKIFRLKRYALLIIISGLITLSIALSIYFDILENQVRGYRIGTRSHIS